MASVKRNPRMTQQQQQKQTLPVQEDPHDYDNDNTTSPMSSGAPVAVASSSAFVAVSSPGKQPLSQKQLKALFNSTESRRSTGADLSMIYASTDSIVSKSSLEFWKSNDISGLFSSGDDLPALRPSVEGYAKPFASIDAAEGLICSTDPQDSVPKEAVYASIDPLPLKGLDEKPSANAEYQEVGIYESREWLSEYEGNHRDVAYGKDLFTEAAPTTRKRTRWEDQYLAGLQVPDTTTESKKAKPTLPAASKNKTTESKRREPKEKIYVEPLDVDIISGRGGKSNSWPGNERYREVIEGMKPAYREGAKFEKTIKSQEAVELLLGEGRRFLKLEEAGPHQGDYYIMTKNQARKKAGQALREENTPESRKKKREFYAKKNRAKKN